MKSELFGFKITKIEKDAVQYISQRGNKPASKLFYQDFLRALRIKLGVTLLFDIGHAGEFDDAFTAILNTDSVQLRRHPNIIEDFLTIIERTQMKQRFRSIFSDIDFEDRGFLLYEIDFTALAHQLGAEYLAQHGSFDPVRLDLIYDIFFEYILSTYYQLTAIGSMHTLSEAWDANRSRTRQLTDLIKSMYEEEFEQAVEVTEEAVIVDALKQPKPRPSTTAVRSSSDRCHESETGSIQKRDKGSVSSATGSGGAKGKERRKRTKKRRTT